jgi:hypothetical protein
VENASNFILKNFLGYVKALLATPVEAAKFWLKLKKPQKLSPEILTEILKGAANVRFQTVK